MALILHQFGEDPFNLEFRDPDGLKAFAMSQATDANVITRLGREEKWVKLHSNVRGPESSLFFFGANHATGYVLYGHSLPKKNMVDLLTQKKERSSSRYFKLLNGKEFKWAVGSHFMECLDGRTSLAVWRSTPPHEPHAAVLTLETGALPYLTEIMTTLVLNRMAQQLGW